MGTARSSSHPPGVCIANGMPRRRASRAPIAEHRLLQEMHGQGASMQGTAAGNGGPHTRDHL